MPAAKTPVPNAAYLFACVLAGLAILAIDRGHSYLSGLGLGLACVGMARGLIALAAKAK
jgi:hypothetical protein